MTGRVAHGSGLPERVVADGGRWRWFLTVHRLGQLGKRVLKGRVPPGEAATVLDEIAADRPD